MVVNLYLIGENLFHQLHVVYISVMQKWLGLVKFLTSENLLFELCTQLNFVVCMCAQSMALCV